MNAFLKKEIRLLLPAFLIALVSAFSTTFLNDSKNYYSGFRAAIVILPFVLSPALVLMMALGSFGAEISGGTFAQLLAQPVSRRKIWWTKTLLLTIGIFLTWLAWWLGYIGNKNFSLKPDELREVFLTTGLMPLVIFSGGLWTVLLLRQVAAAFWFTLIVPATLMMPFLFLSQKYPDITQPGLIIVLSLYSIAGFFFARWLFLRAQDVQWTGGEIALPGFFPSLKLKVGSKTERNWKPRTALFAKEFQLHQSQLVMAGALLLLHLGVIATRKFGDFKDSPGTEFVLSTFWVLWFVMPLVVGCAAVAEERKLGTLESQLCLPARRRTQFGIKFLFAMMLSLILAVAVPLLLEGSRILPGFHLNILEALKQIFFKREGYFSAMGNAFDLVNFSMPVLVLLGIATVIAAVSFYASTLSRNTLQSLAPAVLGIVVAFTLLIGAPDVGKVLPFVPWRGWLIYLIGVPVLGVMLVSLMHWNFKRVWLGGKVWLRNIIVLIATLTFVIGATSAIYHRVWGFLTPLEPAHGAARLSSSDLVEIETLGSAITVQFHDGRVWSGNFVPSAPNLTTMLSGNWKMKPLFGGGKFQDQTNWTSVATSHNGMFGIQKDGSLWASDVPRRNSKTDESKLVRIGMANDWKGVSGQYPFTWFLKKNGTLWRLNTETWNRKKEPWPGIRNFALKPLGTDSDWSDISQMEWRTILRKAGGEAWISNFRTAIDAQQMKLDEKTILYRAEYLDGLKSGAWAWGNKSGNFFAGVREDGTLVVSADFSSRDLGRESLGIQLGKKSDWLAVAGEGETIVSLKADGSLWKWNFSDDPVKYPDSASAIRLSRHSDWLAVSDFFGSVIGLAADGSLWFWQSDDRDFFPSEAAVYPLLSASRKPQKIGDIFDWVNVPNQR